MVKSILCLILLGLVAYGCTSPANSFHQVALSNSLQPKQIVAQGFKHQLYTKNINADNSTLHVYLDGDGSPWLDNRYVTQDPTPLQFTVLQLMQHDKNPSIYLGRPCYHQTRPEPLCQEKLWTSARYSAVIVESMAMVLNAYLEQHPFKKVILIGFSGGGTLAVLMASKVPNTKAIITLAGNLDIDAWATYHHYSLLAESLNPAKQIPLASNIKQLHLVGSKDKNITANLSEGFLKKQYNTHLLIIPNADHHCCWQEALNKALDKINMNQ